MGTTPPPAVTDEYDLPLGGLAGLTRIRFERTYMEAVAAEVRFVPTRSELSEEDAKRIWLALGQESWPIFQPHSQNIVTVTVTPDGAQQAVQTQSGWLLSGADRREAITLLPALVLVQTQQYERYSASLGNPLSRALAVFTDVTGASVVTRLGLRYVNRLTDPGATRPSFWAGHIRPPFAGLLAGPLANLVDSQHQQVELRLDPSATARLQWGVYQDPSPGEQHSFLVDLDVFREQAFEYEARRCADLTRQLNRTALALFSEVLSEQYMADLGPVVIEEEDTCR